MFLAAFFRSVPFETSSLLGILELTGNEGDVVGEGEGGGEGEGEGEGVDQGEGEGEGEGESEGVTGGVADGVADGGLTDPTGNVFSGPFNGTAIWSV